MVRVMATGTFDLLHIGHLYYLEEAKKLGDELIVVIANDETVRKNKHNPVTPQEMRCKLVEALKPVDKAVIGYKDDFLKIVEEIKPDIIALGYDQNFDEEEIRNALKRRGLNVKIVRCSKYSGDDLNGTRKIIRKIADMIDSKKLYRGENR